MIFPTGYFPQSAFILRHLAYFLRSISFIFGYFYENKLILGKISGYNHFVTDEPVSPAMIIQRIPLIFATSLVAAALSACGAGNLDAADTAVQTAAVSTSAQTASHAVDLSVDPAAVGQTPAPDCAADNCAGLRIIDGNAEAFRIDAMRRAAREQGA